ncbi:uncharacterized protein [Watersipora subatra]|uniref:uncharacterized protein n=1 Tax=Watersipora subatra TaxID=2589382 RepID=UPI00355BB144
MIKISMITILHNFSYFYEPCIPIMRERGTISLARTLRLQAQDSGTSTDCLLIIAFLMNEADSKKLMKIADDELSYLISELEKSMLRAGASDYHPEEIIDGLNRIAVSDINKLKLIECGVLKLLSKSLNPVKSHTTVHRAAAAKAIWNLAFSEESREEIKAQKGLISALKSFKDSENKELRLAVSGALWQLEGKEKHLEEISVDVKEAEQKHIMLSYNHQAKTEVNKMKDLLKQRGFKVWIDHEQITAGGSTLEAMSTAIEDSCLVLIFFSEPYKNSINCRAEAEYVFERRKPFIPVQVQAGYTPEGWLGILFGSKFRYTLCKPDKYKTEVEGLLGKVKELASSQAQPVAAKDVPDGIIPASTTLPATTSPQLPSPSLPPLECESWSWQQTSEWLDDNKLGPIKDSLEDADGTMLAELAMLSYQHKDVFYTLICSKTGADLGCILRFSKALKKLT